jgi:hypothetical protein
MEKELFMNLFYLMILKQIKDGHLLENLKEQYQKAWGEMIRDHRIQITPFLEII